MKRVMTLGLGLLMSAPFAGAQAGAQYEKPLPQGGAMTAQIEMLTPGGSGSKSTVFVYPAIPVCPVSMHAKQGSGGGLVAVRGKEPSATGPAQRIHLVVDHGKSVKVTGAHVRVYGMSGRNHIQNAMMGPDAGVDFRRTMDVGFTAENERESGTDLVLPGFTAVSRIVLQSITYDDGSTWTPGRNQMCAAAPDPFMLVADR